MKMNPDEHRLIRESVEVCANGIRTAISEGAFVGKEKQDAREKEAKLRLLLTKL